MLSNLIVVAMEFIASSGVLMDLSMDIASACAELMLHKPDISRKELRRSGFAVGRSVIGIMATTPTILMLAYSGSYLSLLMYFAGQGTPVIDILNLKYVASEVLITLVGSFCLVTVAPFTAVVTAMLGRVQTDGTLENRLNAYGVQQLSVSDSSTSECKSIEKRFLRNVVPLLSPQIIDNRQGLQGLYRRQICQY